MQTKLTLRLEQRLIQRAKAYAERTGKSVSGIVADFFARLDAPSGPAGDDTAPQSPAVRALAGALAGTKVEEATYRLHLTHKHR